MSSYMGGPWKKVCFGRERDDCAFICVMKFFGFFLVKNDHDDDDVGGYELVLMIKMTLNLHFHFVKSLKFMIFIYFFSLPSFFF